MKKEKNKRSLLARCEKIRSEYDGLLHSGVIHYIQSKMPDFTLKAAIYRVLDKCPSVWPEDLPEQLKAGKEPKITKAMKKEFRELNEGLLIPIQGGEIAEIIRLAKEFLSLKDEKQKSRWRTKKTKRN
jgi:hypothetical protein